MGVSGLSFDEVTHGCAERGMLKWKKSKIHYL